MRDHSPEELSHYSAGTTDIEYLFPFGWGELWGIADRTDFDLRSHNDVSGESMYYVDPDADQSLPKDDPQRRYIPYCIEPSLGADRVALAFMVNAYHEETLTDDKGKEDTRVVMKFHPALAPFKAAILPLTKKQSEEATALYTELSKHFMVDYDAAGTIGKRYRREDEIGTPYCICVDFDTAEDGCVTIRDRDTMEQIRIPMDQVKAYIDEKLNF